MHGFVIFLLGKGNLKGSFTDPPVGFFPEMKKKKKVNLKDIIAYFLSNFSLFGQAAYYYSQNLCGDIHQQSTFGCS
jgi:hypothetical protein